MTTARIERARIELERLRREAIDAETNASRFGPNCRSCRHSSMDGRICYHPAVQSVSVDWCGRVTMSGDRPAMDMRAEDGLCGPESALFDKRQFYRRIPWFAVVGVCWAIPWILMGSVAILVALFGVFGVIAELNSGRWSLNSVG